MLTGWRSPKARLAANGATIAVGLLVTVLAGRHFASKGWPLAHADVGLLAASAIFFLVGYAFKAYGWSKLFAPHERPGIAGLAAAGGAASVTGIALPGRFDDVVRIAVVRRHRGCPAGIKALMLSLVTLALIDTVALSPLASSAAALADIPVVARVGLAIVAGAGIGAALIVVALPRIGKHGRLLRFRLARWISEHSPATRQASKAFVFVLASWVVRGIGLVLLLGALGIGLSLPLALVFLVAGAASAALPIAPAGAATQAGAGAGALVASGVSASQAISFAIGAQMLAIFAGVAAILVATAWTAGQRLNARRTAAA